MPIWMISESSVPELIGYALYFYTYSTWEGRMLYMEDLYVCPEYRGEGVGSRLWKTVAKVWNLFYTLSVFFCDNFVYVNNCLAWCGCCFKVWFAGTVNSELFSFVRSHVAHLFRALPPLGLSPMRWENVWVRASGLAGFFSGRTWESHTSNPQMVVDFPRSLPRFLPL